MTRPFLRNRHRLVPLALLGALTLGSACKPEDPKQDDPKAAGSGSGSTTDKPALPTGGLVANPTDSPAIAEVGEVIATVQLPSGTKMTDIAAVIDGIQPGASAMLAMQLPAALEQAAGFDIAKSAKLDAPLSFVILNPASHPQPLALLVEAKDAAALTEQAKAAGHEVAQKDNLLLIGPAGVVNAAKDFAFGNLTKYPDHSEIIIYPKPLIGSFSGKLEEGLSSSMAMLGPGNDGVAKMMQGYIKGLISLGEQSERVVVSVGGSQGNAELIARLYPVAGSTLASFIEAQVPTQHTLIGKLPAGGGTMVMSGDWRAGAARAALLDFTVGLIAPLYGNMPTDEWLTMLTTWLDNLDGSVAMTMSMTITPDQPAPVMAMRSLMGVNDSEALRKSWREMLTKMAAGPGLEMMGMKITSKHQENVLEHDGVAIDLYSSGIDTSAMPPEQAKAIEASGSVNQSMYFAAFDKFAAMATVDADGQAMRSVIDAARGKGGAIEISGALAGVIEASKQRGDSLVMYMDFKSMLAGVPNAGQVPFTAMTWALGKHQGALSMRIGLAK